jgi:hypothetical protein
MEIRPLKPFDVILKKGIMTIRISAIMAICEAVAIHKALIILKEDNDLKDITNWQATAEIIN